MVKIYVLVNPLTDMVIYVGASKNPKGRYYAHLADGIMGEMSYKARQIRKIRAAKQYPVLKIVHECDKKEGTYWENFYIQKHDLTKRQQISNYSSFMEYVDKSTELKRSLRKKQTA